MLTVKFYLCVNICHTFEQKHLLNKLGGVSEGTKV